MRKWAESGINDTELTTALERQGYTSKESTPEQLWEAVYRGHTGIECMNLDRMYDEGRLYQDANGTTPVTGVEQPVGLMLDGSQRLRLGPERVKNGGFDDDSDWLLNGQFTISGGKGVCESDGTYSAIHQNGILEKGKLYAVTFTISEHTTGRIRVRPGSQSPYATWKSNGMKTHYFLAETTSFYIERDSGACSMKIDDISVREILGNHPHQPTAMNRPVLSARVNQAKDTEDLHGSSWHTQGTSAIVDAKTVSFPAEGDYLSHSEAYGGVANESTATARIVLSGSGTCTIRMSRGLGGPYDYTDETINLTPTPTEYRVSHTLAPGDSGFRFSLRRHVGNTANHVMATKIDIRHTNMFTATLPAYQRVGDVDAIPGDYDSHNFPMYLAFNGTNQNLKVTGMQPKVDEVFVSAAARKESDESNAALIEYGDMNITGNMFQLGSPIESIGDSYRFYSKGTIGRSCKTHLTEYPAPISNIVTGIGNISEDICLFRVNGVQKDENTINQGTGNYGNHDLYIGSRAGTALFYTGRLYGLVLVFDNPPDDVIATIEHTLNRNAKIHA